MVLNDAIYDDGRIRLDADGLTIRWYYLWGSRRIPYSKIKSFQSYELDALRGRWRIWGSGDFTHWYNLDRSRPRKRRGIEIDVGGRVLPCITPDRVDEVMEIFESKLPR